MLFVNWSSALYIADEKMEQVLLSLNALPGVSSLFSVSALASPYARVEGLPLLFTIDGYNGLLQRATPRRGKYVFWLTLMYTLGEDYRICIFGNVIIYIILYL